MLITLDDDSFVFHAGNLIQRKISKSVSTQYIKKYVGEDDPTVSELLELSEHDKKKFCQSAFLDFTDPGDRCILG